MRVYRSLLISLLFLSPLASANSTLVMNGVALDERQIQDLEQAHGIKTQPANVWCDPISGLWGLQGQHALGVMYPQYCLGNLAENASGGNTHFFLNNRRLTVLEVMYWANLLRIPNPVPGQYWLSAQGVFSGVNPLTAQPFAFNILQGVAQAQRGGGQFRRNFYTGIGSGSAGGCSYVMGSDFSVTTGNC